MAVRYHLGDGWFLAEKTGRVFAEQTGMSDTEINNFLQNHKINDVTNHNTIYLDKNAVYSNLPRLEIGGYTLTPDEDGKVAYKMW